MAVVFFESASELARLSNTFTVDSVPTDPTTITLTVTSPAQVATSYTYAAAQVERVSAGVYRKDVACSEAGTWAYQWVGTGTATDMEAGTFEVFPTSLGKLYATVSDLKSRFGISDSVDDFELHQACFAASRAVENHTQRLFWRTASGTARTFVADDMYRLILPAFCDVFSVSALATDDDADGVFETVWSAGDYQLLPLNPAAAPETRPYSEVKAVGAYTFPLPVSGYAGRDDKVQVTGVFGWPFVPHSVKQAALILAHETFKAKDSVGGVAGFGEFGVVRLGTSPLFGTYLNPYMSAFAQGFA